MPLYIDVSGKTVVVFGGGSVGGRRARMFSEAGARVVVAAEWFSREVEDLASKGAVELVKLKLPDDLGKARELIDRAWLVVVALGDKEAARVVAEEALKRGKLVNNAIEANLGDVVVPFRAVVWSDLHIAVTSLGLTGIGARTALEEAVRFLESRKDLRNLYESLKLVKKTLKSKIPDVRVRIDLYFKIASDSEFQRLAKAGRVEEALERALTIAGLERVNA